MAGNQQPHSATLPSWTHVVTPQNGITTGKLSIDTYTINLDLAIQGDPHVHEVYRDPRAFFNATFLTSGLRHILSDVMNVLAGQSNKHVFQLRAPVGAGKTHALLALYHLARSRATLHDLPTLASLPDLDAIRIAIISGYPDGSSWYKRTLWGELAWQLGGEEGYALVAEQDRSGVVPQGDTLREIIGPQPTLLLLDDILSYIANTQAVAVRKSTLGRQTLTFLQRLVKAIAASPHAALIYTLPTGAQDGAGQQELLDTLGAIGRRATTIHEPVRGKDVLHIVQQRLFAGLGDRSQHEQVAQTYADASLHSALAEGLSHAEAQQQADQLRTGILLSYPFHPALLNVIRERWSTLSSYHHTRGALRILATAVQTLWSEHAQTQPLLGVGDLPLQNEAVRQTLLEQVGANNQYDIVLLADLLGSDAGASYIDQLWLHENPQLQAYPPGVRLATATLLYSFGGSNPLAHGVTERELLNACLVPGLESNILIPVLSDLNECLLYLHQHEYCYCFETYPDLNKMIDDEQQWCDETEIEARLRSALSHIIGPAHEAVIWPENSVNVRDRLEEYQIVYLSPQWLDANPDPEKQEAARRRFINECGHPRRQNRNHLTLAVPDPQSIQEARNAARTLIALELLQSQSAQWQFTTQQHADLAERKSQAEDALRRSLAHLYTTVYTPMPNAQDEQGYTFEALDIPNNDQAIFLHANQTIFLHERIKGVLYNRIVWDYIEPSALMSLTRLNEAEDITQQYFDVATLISSFFCHHNWPHVWNANVLRRAIIAGIKNRTFGYVTNVPLDGLQRPIFKDIAASCVFFDVDLPWNDLHTGSGAYIVSVAFAQQLLRPPLLSQAEPAMHASREEQDQYISPSARSTGDAALSRLAVSPQPRPTVAADQRGQRYRLALHSRNPGDFEDIQQALERLEQQSATLSITIEITATSKPSQWFQRNTLHNLIVEPLTEDKKVEVIKEEIGE